MEQFKVIMVFKFTLTRVCRKIRCYVWSFLALSLMNSEQENLIQYGNIMYDRRVIRGNTYALNTIPAVSISLFLVYHFVMLAI